MMLRIVVPRYLLVGFSYQRLFGNTDAILPGLERIGREGEKEKRPRYSRCAIYNTYRRTCKRGLVIFYGFADRNGCANFHESGTLVSFL